MYAKFISDMMIEEAPVNKDGVFNYNLNIELMIKDGYKEVVELEKPLEFIEPVYKYRELEDKIEKYWIDLYVKPSLEELKIIKRAEINQARDEAEQGGFTYLDKIFDSDQVACQRMSMAAQAMQMAVMSEQTPTITWTCKDNSTIELNAQQLAGLIVALAEWSNTCHQKATELKAKIEACTTEEELNQIVWEK